MIVQRVERHIVRQGDKFFKMLDDFCFTIIQITSLERNLSRMGSGFAIMI